MEEYSECKYCEGTGKYYDHRCTFSRANRLVYNSCMRDVNFSCLFIGCLKSDIKCIFYKYVQTIYGCRFCNGEGKISWIDNLFTR